MLWMCVFVCDVTQVCSSKKRGNKRKKRENSLIKVSVEVRIVLQGAASSPLSQIDHRAKMQCLYTSLRREPGFY